MTNASNELLLRIARMHRLKGSPDYKLWYFDAGLTSDSHLALADAGVITKLLGTECGYAWRLTEFGRDKVQALVGLTSKTGT